MSLRSGLAAYAPSFISLHCLPQPTLPEVRLAENLSSSEHRYFRPTVAQKALVFGYAVRQFIDQVPL